MLNVIRVAVPSAFFFSLLLARLEVTVAEIIYSNPTDVLVEGE